MTIYYWPDGCWCEASELASMSHKSDDFTPLVLPDDTDDERAWMRSYELSLNARAKVEQELIDCANGKRPLPDAAQCRDWAARLGVPSWWRDAR